MVNVIEECPSSTCHSRGESCMFAYINTVATASVSCWTSRSGNYISRESGYVIQWLEYEVFTCMYAPNPVCHNRASLQLFVCLSVVCCLLFVCLLFVGCLSVVCLSACLYGVYGLTALQRCGYYGVYEFRCRLVTSMVVLVCEHVYTYTHTPAMPCHAMPCHLPLHGARLSLY